MDASLGAATRPVPRPVRAARPLPTTTPHTPWSLGTTSDRCPASESHSARQWVRSVARKRPPPGRGPIGMNSPAQKETVVKCALIHNARRLAGAPGDAERESHAIDLIEHMCVVLFDDEHPRRGSSHRRSRICCRRSPDSAFPFASAFCHPIIVDSSYRVSGSFSMTRHEIPDRRFRSMCTA